MRGPVDGWFARVIVCAGAPVVLLAAACSGAGDSDGGAMGSGGNAGFPSSPPSTPAPTGSKWVGVEVEGDCGRLTIAWLLADEMCGGTDDPAYLDTLRAPIFRDGALIGERLYTVDATHVWVLDVTTPDAPARETLIAGLGHPIGVGTHAGRLLVAAGDLGLVIADVTQPDHPTPIATLALPGPALDVTVDGDRALVPMGKAGVAVIDLTKPELVRTVQTPGFAVGVAAAGNVGYVAACDTFATVDLESGAPLGQTWLPGAYDGQLLVAPAKDVTVAGDTAYVAAGRYGAVRIDVSVPEQMNVLGNCTIESDLAFYASGVRAADDLLYVAGGEWGILPVEMNSPGACTTLSAPMLPPTESSEDETCNPKPPWEVMPWQDLWAPPPPAVNTPLPQAGKDPLQTLPAGDVLYAFGDARRLGVRAVDVRETTISLDKLGRYEEPRLVTDLAARNGRVLITGPAGGLFVEDPTLLLAHVATPPEIADGIAATMLADGRWAFSTASGVHVEDTTAIALVAAPSWKGISSVDQKIAIASHDGAWLLDVESGSLMPLSAPKAELPPVVLARSEGIFMAAPEWTHALRLDAGTAPEELAENGVFGAEEILDGNLWREGLPRRLLAGAPGGVIEIATLGNRAGLTLHGALGKSHELALPSGTYVDAAAAGDTLYLVLADRDIYRSAITTVKLGASSAEIVHTTSFTGIAMAAAVDGQRLYVADADRGVRVYSITTTMPAALGVIDLEAAP